MFCKVIEICKIQFILFLHTSGNKFLLGTVARHHLLQPKLIISLLSRIILMLVSEHFQRSLVPTPECISMFPRSNQLTKVGVMFANKSLCGRDILTLSSEEGLETLGRLGNNIALLFLSIPSPKNGEIIEHLPADNLRPPINNELVHKHWRLQA